METKMKLATPWVTYYNEVKDLFCEDKDVRVEFIPEQYKIKLFVNGREKAAALDKVLLHEKKFGVVTVTIDVIPENRDEAEDWAELYRAAFKGNKALDRVEVKPLMVTDATYVVWSFAACQFYNDDLGDVEGNCTMLLSDVAKDVLQPRLGLYHCMKPQRKEKACGKHFSTCVLDEMEN